MNYKDYIKAVPDFPEKGIIFRDITPLMADGVAFHAACREMTEFAKAVGAEVIVGPEARGFIFGCPVAYELGIGFIPVRKPHKLPRKTVSVEYALEYGTNELSIHADALKPGQKVLIVDDLLATGGTVAAAARLVESLGAEVVGMGFLVELAELGGRERISGYPHLILTSY